MYIYIYNIYYIYACNITLHYPVVQLYKDENNANLRRAGGCTSGVTDGIAW